MRHGLPYLAVVIFWIFCAFIAYNHYKECRNQYVQGYMDGFQDQRKEIPPFSTVNVNLN
jgi:hypothetical protein